jgi:hypothetical protein
VPKEDRAACAAAGLLLFPAERHVVLRVLVQSIHPD